jgi:putative CocE/NonD family hydrolase
MMSLSRSAKIPGKTLACLAFLFAAIVVPVFTYCVIHGHSIVSRSAGAQADTRLSGDYDYYVMLGAAPNGGFEARRRMGFAHFDTASANGAWFKRRSGAPLYTITKLTVAGDNITVSLENGSEIVGLMKGNDFEGRIYRDAKPIDRIWLVKRTDPITWESNYALWPGDASRPTFQVTVDTSVPMTARDGTTLMNYVARPVGAGPFGVVLERTPYLRFDKANGEFWAARGFIYVKQDARGRGGSGGVLDMNSMQDQDGYDAVEWAAKMPGSNGKVGMIGGSDPGLLAWYAAIAAPPHLVTIAPTVATADPLRIVPYIDMVFSPTVVPWLCLTALKDKNSEMSNVNEVEAFAHLPVIDAAELAGCPRPQYWNDWFDHQKDDAYWRARSVERRLDRVKVPVLGISGWHDDARGTIRNYTVMSRLRGAPPYHVVMDAGAHKGIDYVNGYFGPQARVDRRELQLRWLDHYLKGIDNGVDVQAPLDIFVIGDNTWRKEREWPLARTVWTRLYLRQNGKLETTAPGKEPPDEYRYDPGNPTPFLVDARELELSLNEDYRTVDSERKDLVTYTTTPLAKDTEITGPMTATLWAVTEGKDTDWNVMLQHVYPDGRAERIQDGVMRARFRDGFDRPSLLKPGKAYKYDIDLWFTSRVIPAGHRLRVVVASAAFPKYDRNLNTGGDNERDTRYVVVRQRILHDRAHPSFVRLPIIPR